MIKGKGSGSSTAKSAWIDISIPIRSGMVVGPHDPPTKVELFLDADKGDRVTMSQITMVSHAGTHIDTPRHFFRHGTTVDVMPLDTAVGSARVIEIKDPVSIKPGELKLYNIQPGERILFKTRNSAEAYRTDEFVKDYVYISPEAARFLVERKARVVGIDYITVGGYDSYEGLVETHETLLGNGVYIIEALNLSGVKAGGYELIAVPIRLEQGDAGPCRAIIRPLE